MAGTSEARGKIRTWIGDNPFTSIAIAAGGGFIAGAMLAARIARFFLGA